MEDSTKRIVQGFLIGAAAGVVAGLLLAPGTGKETRKVIADSAKDLTDKFGSQFEETLNKLSHFTESTLAGVKNAAKGQQASNN